MFNVRVTLLSNLASSDSRFDRNSPRIVRRAIAVLSAVKKLVPVLRYRSLSPYLLQVVVPDTFGNHIHNNVDPDRTSL